MGYNPQESQGRTPAKYHGTVDGWNPAPPGMYETL